MKQLGRFYHIVYSGSIIRFSETDVQKIILQANDLNNTKNDKIALFKMYFKLLSYKSAFA